MKTLNERRHHDNIQLQNSEKFVLTKLIAAKTPETAFEEVTRGDNVLAARDKMISLNLMTLTDTTAEITENGKEVLRKEALLDEMDQLTEQGQVWGYANTPEEAGQAVAAQDGKPEAPIEPSQQLQPKGGNMASDTQGVASQEAGAPDAFSLEGLTLLRSFQEILKEQDFLKKTKS